MRIWHRRAAVALPCALILLSTVGHGYAESSADPGRTSAAIAPADRERLDLWYGFVRASVVITKGGQTFQRGVVGDVFSFCTPDHDTDEIAESAKWRILTDVRSATGASKVEIVYGPWINSRAKRADAIRDRQASLRRGSIRVVHSFAAYARPASCRR